MEEKSSIASKYLELSTPEYLNLLALQKLLIINDIAMGANTEAAEAKELLQKKEKWLAEWEASLCEGLKLPGIDLTEQEVMKNVRSFPVPKLILFLLEAHAFVPYFPIDEKRGSGVPKKEVFTNDARKVWNARLDAFVFQGKIDRNLLATIRTVYAEAVREVPGTDWKSLARNLTIIAGSAALLGVTGGVAAPWIGTFIGASFLGLSGAAATSAGLALLGGGAIAVGGAGMAGGTVVLVGGSALLGSLIGRKLSSTNSDESLDANSLSVFDTNFLISQAARIETIARVAVTKSDLDEFVREVLRDYRANIAKLDQLIGLGEALAKKYPKLSPDTLQRNRRILENAAKRLRDVF